MRHGYLLALTLVAALTLVGLILKNSVLQVLTADATIINVAGRQRMFSQKVFRLALEIEQASARGAPPEAVSHANTLTATVREWRATHADLRDRPNTRFPGQNSRAVTHLIAAAEVHLFPFADAGDHIASLAATGGASPAEIASDMAILRQQEKNFIEAMEAIVAAYEAESLARVKLLNDIESGLVVACLFTLVLEALLIFRPVLVLLAGTQRRLRAALAALSASERSKSALIQAVPDVVVQVDRARTCRLVHVPDHADLPVLSRLREGRPLEDALPPRAAREITERIELVRRRELTERFELSLPGPANERHLDVRIALAGLDDVLVLLRDITEQRALEREMVTVASEERRRIGYDLHDGLLQQVAGLSLLVGSLDRQIREHEVPDRDLKLLEQIGELIDSTLVEGRRLARAFHPTSFDADGLVSALDELARSLHRLHGVPCLTEVDVGDWQPSSATALELFRIAQEAAGNAARHSGAASIKIRLDREDDHILLSVVDDGVGLERARQVTRGGGLGLRIMSYRAHIIGAKLHVTSNGVSGTIVSCEVPLAAGRDWV